MRLERRLFLLLLFLGILALAVFLFHSLIPQAFARISCPYGYTACCGNCFDKYINPRSETFSVYCGPGHLTDGGCTPEYNCGNPRRGDSSLLYTWCEGQRCCETGDGGNGGDGEGDCPTNHPYNGQSCTVHPPGGQCPSNYQWCDGGCCRYTGGGSNGGGGGWSCPSYPGCQPGQCGVITQYRTCTKQTSWTVQCFNGQRCNSVIGWPHDGCPGSFPWCYGGWCKRANSCTSDYQEYKTDYKTESRNINCGACCTSHASYSCYDNDVYWYDSCGKREGKKEECYSDYQAGYRCSGSWRQQEYVHRGCLNNSCYSWSEWVDVENCGSDYCEAWGSNYCKDNDVYHQRTCHSRGCSGNSCYDNTWPDEQKVADCPYCCSNGSCTGVCSSGSNQSQACGNCGTQSRTCQTNCQWGSWGACAGNAGIEGQACPCCLGYNCLSSASATICCSSANNCVVEGACRNSVSKACDANDAKDHSIYELGDSIDDYWCTWNEHDGCLVKSGVELVNGQINPGYWEGESCGGDGGSSILYGEKKVKIDDISKYIIKARDLIDDNSWVWINGNEVPGLHRGCCGWTGWVDVTNYFNTGWNTIKFKAEDTCSGGRYFNLDWDVSLKNTAPQASITCNPATCSVYQGEILTLLNQSTDPDGQNDIKKSEWDILNWGSDPDLSCTTNPFCNFTPQSSILGPGSFTAELYVEDKAGAWDTDTQNFSIKSDALAGFMCSLDNSNWRACENLNPSTGETVYFKDHPSLAEHSEPSQGATITKRTWKLNTTPFDSDNNQNPSLIPAEGTNTIELTILDSASRTASRAHTISITLPLPLWKEIAPF